MDTAQEFSDLPYFPDPKNDNERLLNLQYEFKNNGDAEALDIMYRLGCKVAKRFINSETGGRFLCNSDKEEKAHNAITYIIARYLRVKNFAIKKSFTAYLYLRVKFELYHQRKIDKIIDFVEWL